MKRSVKILGVLWIGVIGVAACGKGPTAPPGGQQGGGDPAVSDISGPWKGSVTGRVGFCPAEPFTVDLVQSVENAHGFSGGKAVGSFATPCQGAFALQLFINKDGNLLGSVGGKGHVSGNASPSGLEFEIIGGQGGLDNGQVVVAQVSMTR